MTTPSDTAINPFTDPQTVKTGSNENQVRYTPIDLWGAAKDHTWEFPGQENIPAEHRQAIFFTSMNEGARSRFQKETARPFQVDRDKGDTSITVDQAADRHSLLRTSIKGWKMFRDNEEIAYRPHLLAEWLKFADPAHVDKLENAIREANPWMLNEMSSEALQQEIDKLEEKRILAVKREEEEANFDGK